MTQIIVSAQDVTTYDMKKGLDFDILIVGAHPCRRRAVDIGGYGSIAPQTRIGVTGGVGGRREERAGEIGGEDRAQREGVVVSRRKQVKGGGREGEGSVIMVFFFCYSESVVVLFFGLGL